jgi:hypothetical protein
MSSAPVSPEPGRDEEWEAWLADATLASLDSWEEPDLDPEPWPWMSDDPLDLPEAGSPRAGRLGYQVREEDLGSAAGFASGWPLDTGPGCSALMGFAEDAAGAGDSYTGATDDELTGVICAWDRVEAAASARKHAAVAELIRRNPAPGCAPAPGTPQGQARMPGCWAEFTDTELSHALADSRHAAETMLDLAWDLQVKLPGTLALYLAGRLRHSKVVIIAAATAILDPAEARAAEALVLGRAGRLTPGGLRSAIARAVAEVAPEKARKRREAAAKDARVERWPEDSGNAALIGRELPPAEVLAADQRITWWASQLKKAGLDGSMDELRARAYLDLLLGKDSCPTTPAGTRDSQNGSTSGQNGSTDSQNGSTDDLGSTDGKGDTEGEGSEGPDGPRDGGPEDGGRGDGGRGDGGSGRQDPAGPRTPPGSGVIPAGYIGRNHLTIPLTTLLELAQRPGEIPGIGPVDPWLARDLARASAANAKTTWCLTVTDQDGHAIGHGCARPEPKNHSTPTGKRHKQQPPGGTDPPGGTGSPGSTSPDPPGGSSRDGPRFTFTVEGQDRPPGGYGQWRFGTGIPGQPDLLINIDPIATGTCDHRFEASGHDPGVKLRHLTQIRHATCTGPTCRRPALQCDFEHNTPYEAGGRTCICNGAPKCRHEHRLKQDPRWKVDQHPDGTFTWTAPSGRQYTTEPTSYPT